MEIDLGSRLLLIQSWVSTYRILILVDCFFLVPLHNKFRICVYFCASMTHKCVVNSCLIHHLLDMRLTPNCLKCFLAPVFFCLLLFLLFSSCRLPSVLVAWTIRILPNLFAIISNMAKEIKIKMNPFNDYI